MYGGVVVVETYVCVHLSKNANIHLFFNTLWKIRKKAQLWRGEPVVVVKVVELTARGRAARGRPAGGAGDKQFWRPGHRWWL